MEVSERLAASIFRMNQEVSEELVDGLDGTVKAGRFLNCKNNNIKMCLGVKDMLLEVGQWIDFCD